MHEARQSKPVPWDDPEGWGREGLGRGVQAGGYIAPMTDARGCVAGATTV